MSETIDDPGLVKFANEVLRPMADRIGAVYYRARMVVDAWDAGGLGEIATANGSAVIADGSDRDGRTPLTGDDAHALVERLRSFLADLDADNGARRRVVLKAAVNPQP